MEVGVIELLTKVGIIDPIDKGARLIAAMATRHHTVRLYDPSMDRLPAVSVVDFASLVFGSRVFLPGCSVLWLQCDWDGKREGFHLLPWREPSVCEA